MTFRLISVLRSNITVRSNIFRDGEDNTEEKTEETPPVVNTNQQNPNTGKRFTQEEVNSIIKRDKDATKKERDTLRAQLETFQREGLTKENMAVLEERIEQLTNEGKTHEELAKEKLTKAEKEWQKKFEAKEGEAKNWRGSYETYRSKSEILSAAAGHKANNPDQVYKILKPDTFMVELLDKETHKGTGEWVPRVRLQVTEDGATKTLELSPEDAIKRMTEMEEHHNLFNSGATSGLGGSNNGGRKGSGTTAIPRGNMGSYIAARKANPALLNNAGKKE